MNATAKIYQFPEVVSDPIGSRQMRAQDVVDRLTALIAEHGNLRVDGIEGIEHWEYSKAEKATGMRNYFCIVTGQEVDIY